MEKIKNIKKTFNEWLNPKKEVKRSRYDRKHNDEWDRIVWDNYNPKDYK